MGPNDHQVRDEGRTAGKDASVGTGSCAGAEERGREESREKDSEKLDLNTAAAADLKGAGFSDTEAKKDIVTKEKYEQVKEGIIAHQVKTEAKKK